MENNNFSKSENNILNEYMGYLGGRLNFLITASVVTFIFLICGIYTSAVAIPRARAEAQKRATEESIQASIIAESSLLEEANRSNSMELYSGVYVGATGSVVILYPDGTADYYHALVGLNKGNSWSLESGVITLSINCLYCDVTIEENDPSAVTYNFNSDSIFWDNEVFTKVNSEAMEMTVSELTALVNEQN